MPVHPFQNHQPIIDDSVFIAPDAWIIGKVTIEEHVSIFFNVVVRGDIQEIRIGAGSNLQEHVLVHTSHGMSDVVVGKDVTVGHRAIFHGCCVEDGCLIGMGVTILDNAVIGSQSIIGAHTLIPKGIVIPSRSLVVGTPGKIIRSLLTHELEELQKSAQHYQEMGRYYRKALNCI